MSVTSRLTFAVCGISFTCECRKSKTLKNISIQSVYSVQCNLPTQNPNTLINASLSRYATSYSLAPKPGFLLVYDEQVSDALRRLWNFCPEVVTFEHCGGVHSMFIYYFGQNGRIKPLWLLWLSTVWRAGLSGDGWTYFADRFSEARETLMFIHPVSWTASAGAFNAILCLIVSLESEEGRNKLTSGIHAEDCHVRRRCLYVGVPTCFWPFQTWKYDRRFHQHWICETKRKIIFPLVFQVLKQ